jgi:hypothetical protein
VASTHYETTLTTDVRSQGGSPGSTPVTVHTERTADDDAPLNEALKPFARTWALATADLFSVSTSTSAFFDLNLDQTSTFAKATAESWLEFAPTHDATASLGFQFDVTGLASVFSNGSVGLFDVTTNQALWTYAWDYPFNGNVPWTCCYTANFNVQQQLFASHTYALHMLGSTNANTDSQGLRMSLSGLYRVPEPTGLTALAGGLMLLIVRHRKGRRDRGQG